MPFLLAAAAVVFFALVLSGCFIIAVTSLNGYTLLLLIGVYYLGRLSRSHRRLSIQPKKVIYGTVLRRRRPGADQTPPFGSVLRQGSGYRYPPPPAGLPAGGAPGLRRDGGPDELRSAGGR